MEERHQEIDSSLIPDLIIGAPIPYNDSSSGRFHLFPPVFSHE